MVRKTYFSAVAGLLVLGAAATAVAHDARETSFYEGEAPVDVRDMLRDGPVTVAGLVRLPHKSGVVLDDGTGAIAVNLDHLRPFWPEAGEEVTVLGEFKDGYIKAFQIIRADGTSGRSSDE